MTVLWTEDEVQEFFENGFVKTVDPPAQPVPELPPECWQTAPVDSERAMAAVRAMCGGL